MGADRPALEWEPAARCGLGPPESWHRRRAGTAARIALFGLWLGCAPGPAPGPTTGPTASPAPSSAPSSGPSSAPPPHFTTLATSELSQVGDEAAPSAPASRAAPDSILPADFGCHGCPYDASARWADHHDVDTSRAVRVEEHGAVGDGVTWDHVAIRRAARAAGEGGVVAFTGGKSYVLCAPVVVQVRQTWTSIGSGKATLKRCPAVRSHLTADAPAGSTEIEVADASRFTKTMRISPVVAGGNDHDHGEVDFHSVVAVKGDTVRFLRPLLRSYSAGDKVVTSFGMVRMRAANSAVIDLRFDGDRRHNDDFVAWEIHSSLSALEADRLLVRGCEFVDAQADALSLARLVGARIRNNLFENLNGSGIHLSATTNAVIARNSFRNTNQAKERVAHAEAAVTWSVLNRDVTLRGNCVLRSAGYAFGRIRPTNGDRRARIEGNRVCDSRGFVWVKSGRASHAGVTIRENWVYDSGETTLYNRHGGLSGFSIRDNVIVDSHLLMVNAADVELAGNLIVRSTGAPAETRRPRRSHPSGLVMAWGGENVRIEGNTLLGAAPGILLLGPAVSNPEAVALGGNVVDAAPMLWSALQRLGSSARPSSP